MKRALLPILALFLFSQCKKDQPQELKVSYTVYETSQDQPTFNISFTSDKSGTTNQASSAAETWTSGEILLEQGEFISMKVDCTAPTYDLTMRIYVSGFLWKEQHFSSPTASASLSGTL